MGLIELLLGVVFAAGLAFGIGLGAMGDASGIEFWIARSGFAGSAISVAAAFWWWWGEGSKPITHVVVLGVAAGLWAFLAFPMQLMWIQNREAKIRALEEAAHPKPSPPPIGPDITLRLVYPDYPALILINNSDKIARDIKQSFAIWNLDDPRTYVNQNPAPNAHDPFPIPITTFDYLRPHSESGPASLLGGQYVRPFVKEGQHVLGSIGVICPDCVRGHTYVVYWIVGQGGWYVEAAGLKDQLFKNGELLIPHHFTKELVQGFFQEILSQTPESARIPIR